MKKIIQDCWALFLVFLLLYVLLFFRKVLMAIPSQMYTLQQVCKGEVAMPPTALFYVLGWLAAKWWVTRAVLMDALSMSADRNRVWAGRIGFALCFIGSLPTLNWFNKGWYIIRQASPNYWMNGTLLAF